MKLSANEAGYGTLKAMGAANSYLYKIIIQQALIAATLGYALALGVGLMVVRGSSSGEAAFYCRRK